MSGNACYHLVQHLLSSSLLSKNIKIKIYKTIVLPLVLYGCDFWLLTLRKGCTVRVFKNRVLKRKFAPKRDKVTADCGLQNEGFMIYAAHRILFR